MVRNGEASLKVRTIPAPTADFGDGSSLRPATGLLIRSAAAQDDALRSWMGLLSVRRIVDESGTKCSPPVELSP
ncbi:MAG TPA: hypothetical protein DDZ51_13235 [Planctomycetaceae bacterium]|nr:hypothetical protein [Planctomycetaceae bacterium]